MGHPRLTSFIKRECTLLSFFFFFFFVCTYTDTRIYIYIHIPFAHIRAHLHNHLLAHTLTHTLTRHFTGDHTSCKYACTFKFARVICVLTCKLDHSTTSLPKNRLYSLFSFRFRSPSLKRFYYSSDRTVVHDFFLVKFVNLRERRRRHRISTIFHPSVSSHRSEYAMSRGIEDSKKKKKRKKKNVVNASSCLHSIFSRFITKY